MKDSIGHPLSLASSGDTRPRLVYPVATCDGKRPTCGICLTKSRNCSYDVGLDKRKVSLRKAIEVFSRRVSQLESCLRYEGIAPPEPVLEDAMMLQWLTESYGVPTDAVLESASVAMNGDCHVTLSTDNIIPTSSSDSNLITDATRITSTATNAVQLDPGMSSGLVINVSEPNHVHLHPDPTNQGNPDADLVWFLSTLPSLSMDLQDVFPGPISASLHDDSPGAAQISQNTPEPSATVVAAEEEQDTEEEEETAEVTHQFSNRLGTLLQTSNGEWRFYGATSNLHLIHSSFGEMSPVRSQRCTDTQACFDNASVGHYIDEGLISHLCNLYFTWQNPSLYVVDQAAFESARKDYLEKQVESGLYSDLLVSTICAVGASFERIRHADLPMPLAELFGNRAKSFLDLELDNPRLSTIQALAILSIHEGAATRDTRGWLYSGMAMRLAFDLGLHIDPTSYVTDGKMSAEEARVRNVTFWGTFATDRMWGFYLGRPFHNTLENVTLSRPADNPFGNGDDAGAIWTPYGTPARDQQVLPGFQQLVSGRWIALYEIMSKLGYRMYCKTVIDKTELQRLAEKTYEELLGWKLSLPNELALEVDNMTAEVLLPHTLILHMQYAFCLMILHRPWVAKRYLQPFPRVGKGPEHARSECVQSAVHIAKLIREYETRYSLRRANVLLVHMAFNAALILVYATVSEMDRRTRIGLTAHLDTCSHALAELGNAYESASRTLEILLAIKRMWQARLVGSVGQKRPWRSQPGSEHRKKQSIC